MKLQVATCQHVTSDDPRANTRRVLRQMRAARERGAHVAHFCEGALPGYAGADRASLADLDWGLLEDCTRQVQERARELGLWVLVGSAHRLSGRRKPHNCVYVIDDRGRIADRYDKRFCAGDSSGRTGDLAHYTPGDHACVFTLRGLRCGVLICHDYRYPELARDYARRGVRLLFHAFHAGHAGPARLRRMRAQVGRRHFRLNSGTTLPGITMPATARATAASSHVWVSASNTAARESCFPAFWVRADGVVTGRLRRNRPGVLISTADPAEPLYDSTAAWRGRALRGVLHSGRPARDPRSRRRTGL